MTNQFKNCSSEHAKNYIKHSKSYYEDCANQKTSVVLQSFLLLNKCFLPPNKHD